MRLPERAPIVVCAPRTPVRLPVSIAEPLAPYEAGLEETPAPIRLSRSAMQAFASGTLAAALPLALDAHEVFGVGGRPRLALLARELLALREHLETRWRAIEEVLLWPRTPGRTVRPERVRSRLEAVLARTSGAAADAPVTSALERLRALAGIASPFEVAPSIAELREDVALARCLAERAEEAQELASMRSYLERATPGTGRRALLVDHAATREQLSFFTLLTDPRQLDRMRAVFRAYQQAYAAAYEEHHRRYWRASARLRGLLDDAAPTARALARLNSIDALGRPVGGAALAQYDRLVRGQPSCSVTDLDAALREQPACPACGVTLAESPPSEEAEETLRRLHAALARQQRRLASEAVRRILARGGERLEQFLRIVQASDLTGLVQVIDDELVAFLRELLSQPVTPTREALNLFEQLARAYPTVHEEQLDAVVATLRELLAERLAAQGAEDPTRPAAFQLAALPRGRS